MNAPSLLSLHGQDASWSPTGRTAIAASPRSSPATSVMFVRTLRRGAARCSTQRDFDLVMVGVHFDDSRMFDLLRHLRATGSRLARVICMRSQQLRSRRAITHRGPARSRRRRSAATCSSTSPGTPTTRTGNGAVRKLLDALLSP